MGKTIGQDKHEIETIQAWGNDTPKSQSDTTSWMNIKMKPFNITVKYEPLICETSDEITGACANTMLDIANYTTTYTASFILSLTEDLQAIVLELRFSPSAFPTFTRAGTSTSSAR